MQWNSLGDIFDRQGGPGRPAITDLAPAEPRSWTHGELDEMAGGVARFLTDLGLARGSSVAIMSLNRAEYVAAYFGIMRAGCVAVPVNTKMPAETVSFILSDSGAKFVFADAGNRSLVPEGMPFLDFDEKGDGGFHGRIAPCRFETVAVDADEIAQILYTSGSSGRPKGVLHSHGGQLWSLRLRAASVRPDDRYIVAQPLFHMNGLFLVTLVLAGGSSIVMLPKFDMLRYVEAIDRFGVTDIVAVPTMFARIIREPQLFERFDLSRVRKLRLGSAPLTEALRDKIQARFPSAMMGNGYGTTEAGAAMFGPHPQGVPTPAMSIGYPTDPELVRLARSADPDSGVLQMRGPALMKGYHNLPDLTARVMQDGWYDSGDVMRRDAQGFYFFVGRADDMFVCSAQNIYPGEVERLLDLHPLIQQSAVVPLPDEERGAVPVAFIVAAEGAAPTFEQVKTHAIASGPAYQYPRRVKTVAELPLAGTGKVDRQALAAMAEELERSGGWTR